MKILIFNWRDIKNPDAGGAEVFTHENAKRWVRDGHEVTLFASKFPGCEPKEYLDGIRIVRSGGKFSVYWKAKTGYLQHLSGKDPDVVVDEINTRPFLTPSFVKKAKIVALIHQLAREYWFYETPFPLSYIGYYFLEERWLRKYVNIPTVTVSESTRQDLLELGFKNVFIVPEGLNFSPLDELPEKEAYPVVAYVGRLKRAKRPDHAIKAFTRVKEKIPKAELWFIGEGNYRKNLEGMAKAGVKFFGYLSVSEKNELMKKAWVLVHPSVREGFGLNVVEANALGTPCVAYNVSGLRDSIRDGITGLLVENGNIEALANRVIGLLQNKDLRLKLSQNGLDNAKHFSWDQSARNFLKIIEDCVYG